MFETVELGRKISAKKYNEQVSQFRLNLLTAQFAMAQADFPVIVIISGVDGAGKGELVHRLNAWLDPRHVDTTAFWESSDEVEDRPYYWRFWRALPPKRRIGILFGSWYTRQIIDRVEKKIPKDRFDQEMHRIAFFERVLVNDGAVLVKFWFHLTKQGQFDALKKLEKKNRTQGWVTSSDWEFHEKYDRFLKVSERAIRVTDTGYAPWNLIEAKDRRYRELTAGQILLKAIESRLRESASSVSIPSEPKLTARPVSSKLTVLDQVDLNEKLEDDEYRELLSKYQGELGRLSWEAHRRKVSTVGVFEGWDAAGKGGAIRRIAHAMDPRFLRIIPIAAPTDEEQSQHYLWRFWRHLSRAGRMTLYDRSWYGRVLVERVEGYATSKEWQRAYREINEFEEQLHDYGIVILKFWIHISKEEQLKRFDQRKKTPFKKHKITDEDWRNRKKWDQYSLAINDMVNRTSTENASWTLVAGNDKRFARIQVLKTVCNALKEAL
ncbi:MAG TPA: polyphosphate:AMP phosphotransferase [Verrucomicrobia bacterium]|nr:polyphosphate:AMP phosphotransferase [Verrucomicrobiota bacterium]